MTFLRRTVFWTEGVLVFSLLFIPPFFYGGLGPFATLIIQGLALLIFGFPVSRTLLYPPSNNAWIQRYSHVVILLLAGIPFIAYVFFQVFGGSAALLSHPGSLAPFATTDHLRQLITYVVLFVVFFGFFDSRDRVNSAVLLIAVQMVLLIAIGHFYVASGLGKNPLVLGFLDMRNNYNYFSTFLNPNHFGGFIVLAQPLFFASIAYFLQTREGPFKITPDMIHRVFFALLIPMTMVSVFSAEARTAFFWQILLMAAFVSCFVFRRPRLVLAAGMACAGITAYYLYRLPYLNLSRLSSDLSDRLRFSADAYKAFMDFPWFGAGLGTSHYYLTYYQTVNAENTMLLHPFNHFVQLACETGIVGSVLFLSPVFGYLGFSYGRSQESESRWKRIFGLAAFLALALSAAPALLDNYLATPASAVLAVFYAALLGRCAVRHETAAVTPHSSRKRPSTGRLVMVAGLWACILLTMTVLWSDYRVRKAITVSSKNGHEIEEASRLRSDNADVWGNLGHWHYTEALRAIEQGKDPKPELQQAVYCYHCAAMRAPAFGPSWIGLAKSEMLLSNFERASRYFSFGVGLTPHNRDMILYGIFMQLRLAQTTVWRDEERLFHRRAAYWVWVGSVLPVAIRSNNLFYLLNSSPVTLNDSQKKLVASFISRCYRIPSKHLTS